MSRPRPGVRRRPSPARALVPRGWARTLLGRAARLAARARRRELGGTACSGASRPEVRNAHRPPVAWPTTPASWPPTHPNRVIRAAAGGQRRGSSTRADAARLPGTSPHQPADATIGYALGFSDPARSAAFARVSRPFAAAVPPPAGGGAHGWLRPARISAKPRSASDLRVSEAYFPGKQAPDRAARRAEAGSPLARCARSSTTTRQHQRCCRHCAISRPWRGVAVAIEARSAQLQLPAPPSERSTPRAAARARSPRPARAGSAAPIGQAACRAWRIAQGSRAQASLRTTWIGASAILRAGGVRRRCGSGSRARTMAAARAQSVRPGSGCENAPPVSLIAFIGASTPVVVSKPPRRY